MSRRDGRGVVSGCCDVVNLDVVGGARDNRGTALERAIWICASLSALYAGTLFEAVLFCMVGLKSSGALPRKAEQLCVKPKGNQSVAASGQ